ncbi:MAG: hypothetical protein FJ304_02725 [Planctomycetes bacterium]|nr:hypothetical protein [Planctomycetota bacterium]
MLRFSSAALAVGFLVAAGPARADDAAEAKKLIEKAVKAHGGQEALDRFTGGAVTFKGTFHGMGEGVPVSGTVTTGGADKQRVELEIEAGGQKVSVVVVLAGTKGWSKIIKDVTEMTKDQLAEAREQAYAGWVTTLAPLKSKQFTFATTGEIKVDGKVALGVKVSSKGHRDIDLYFDKVSGLLVKSETRVKDDTSGQEVNEEGFPGDYKDVQGTKQPNQFTVKRDGKLFIEGVASKVELFEKVDDSTFAKP